MSPSEERKRKRAEECLQLLRTRLPQITDFALRHKVLSTVWWDHICDQGLVLEQGLVDLIRARRDTESPDELVVAELVAFGYSIKAARRRIQLRKTYATEQPSFSDRL